MCLGVTFTYLISIHCSFLQPRVSASHHISIYVFVGYLIFFDMYTIGCSLVMVLWKQCLRQGVVCSYKNNNLVVHFIDSIYCVCICGYYVFFATHCW